MGLSLEQLNVIREDDELITDIITRNYYKDFKSSNPLKNIELIINRNNKYSKCYGCFNNTEKMMYPHTDFSENDYDKIYDNFAKFLDFYIENDWHCPIELNGIDWANSNVCEKFLTLLQNIAINNKKFSPQKIIIDTDFYGICSNKDLYNKWVKCYEILKENNIILFFNIYANGLYCDDNNYGEDYYNNLIHIVKEGFLEEQSFKIITYIRPNNIKNWNKNYTWWIDNLDDYAFVKIEIREEKTDKWDYNLISDYILFLNNEIEYFKNKFSKEDLSKIIFDKDEEITYHNLSLLENNYLNNQKKNNNCNFFKNLTIDLTSMNIVPCAKVNYEDFACGQYIIENNKITKIKAKNISIIIYNTHLKQNCLPHCEMCPHIEVCSGHCLGESYNKCYDMLVPIKEFCDLSKAKNNFLVYKYNLLNLLVKKEMEKLGCNEYYIKLLLNFKEKIGGKI